MQITYITAGYNQQNQKVIVWQRGHYDYEIEQMQLKDGKVTAKKTRYNNVSYEQVMEIFQNLLTK